jgi:hypothetical protein
MVPRPEAGTHSVFSLKQCGQTPRGYQCALPHAVQRLMRNFPSFAAAQKAFRLGQLGLKLVQMHEIHARLARAESHAGYRDRFAGKSTRERLAILAADRYPPLPAPRELTLATLFCPFAALVAFVHDRVAVHDFILPPDPRR